MEIKTEPNKADEYNEKNAVITKKKISMKTEIITLDEGDGNLVRGYAIKSPNSSGTHFTAFKFVIIEWQHPNYGHFSDACFFYKALHVMDWNVVTFAAWTWRYKTKEDFLKKFPHFTSLFED